MVRRPTASVCLAIAATLYGTACSGPSSTPAAAIATTTLRSTPEPVTTATTQPPPTPVDTTTVLIKTITATADLDGDGRPDSFSMTGPGPPPAGAWTMTIRLASGATDQQTIGAYAPAVFVVDINHDGRKELLVRTGGETWTIGSLVVYSGGHLQVATLGTGGDPFFGWTAHSNCWCDGTADVACLSIGGRPSFVVTSSQLVPPGWNGQYPVQLSPSEYTSPNLGRAWTRTVYRLSGAVLIPVINDHGLLPPGKQPPAGVPLDNRLACNGVNGL